MKLHVPGLILTGLAVVSFGAAALFFDNTSERTLVSSTVETSSLKSVAAGDDAIQITSNVSVGASSSEAIGAALFGTNIGGSFDLIDHFGEPRQLEDYAGKHVMIFFGYANCLAICSAALPLMADTINLLGDEASTDLVPLMITVDPENDTPDFMRKKLAEYHPALIGMTGSEGQLADVRRKFQVRTEFVANDIDNNPIYNHGSFIYLLGPDGKVKTLVPPILEPKQMAEIFKKYIMADRVQAGKS